MHLFLQKILLIGLFAGLIVVNSFGQVKFSASLSPSHINKDEYTTLRLIVENANDVRKISPPLMKDFIVVSGANQESGMSSVNGVVNQYIAISYILQPRRAGTLSIGKATAVIGGKSYTSNPVKVVVKNAVGASSPNKINTAVNPFAGLSPLDMAPAPREDFRDYILRKDESVQEKVSKNMMLKLETDKTSCYVGEPVVASYRLYTRLKSQSRLTENPSFNGFSVIDLQQPDETDYARSKVKGREFNVYTIRKAQLYPLQDGEIELEKATLENKIQFLKDEASRNSNDVDGFINGFGLSPDALISETVSLTSKPVRITVKPLPTVGKPATFKGAVGKFSMNASLEKANFTTDETGNLFITIEGSGNMQMLTAPDVNWPKALEAFDQKVTEDLVQTDVPVSGRKTFAIPFSVQQAGTYQVPVISFSFFDPQTASYKTINTDPVSFTVVQGTRAPSNDPEKITRENTSSIANKFFDQRGWLVLAIAILFAMGLLYFFLQDKKAGRKIAKQESFNQEAEPVTGMEMRSISYASAAAAEPQNPLGETEDCLESEDCYEFYTILNKELKQFLSRSLEVPMSQITARNIGIELDKNGIENEMALQTEQLMQAIEWQLYTPFERNDTMHDLYSKAQELVQQMTVQQKSSV